MDEYEQEVSERWGSSVEMQKNLALMYLADPRFKKYYDGRVNGLAKYVHDAILAQ